MTRNNFVQFTYLIKLPEILLTKKKITPKLAVSTSGSLTLLPETIEGSNSIQSVDAAMNQFHR